MRKWFFYSFDLLIFALSPFVAMAIRENFDPSWWRVEAIVPYALVGVCVAALVFLIGGTHRRIWQHTSLSDLVRLIVLIMIVVIVTTTIMSVATRLEGVPRSLPIIQLGFLILSLCASRVLFHYRSRKGGRGYRSNDDLVKEHVLLVGVNHVAELYLRCVADMASHRISVEGILDESAKLKNRTLHHHKVVGQPAELPQIIAAFNVHGVTIERVVVTIPFKQLSQQSQKVLLHWERIGQIKLEMFEEKLGFGDAGETQIERSPTPINLAVATNGSEVEECCAGEGFYSYSTLKRGIDMLGSVVLSVVLAPVIAIASLLVAVDVGLPLYFWQLRPGCNGRPFRIYKFRTMKAGHDDFGNRISDDERQTAIGWFLRRTRMDELPQLYHILVGEMSFVGPRPLLPVDLPENRPDLVAARNSIRPGLTGWAQVNGGKDVSKKDKALLDVWYRKHMSLGLDIQILLKTVVMVVTGEKLNIAAIEQAYQELEPSSSMDCKADKAVNIDKNAAEPLLAVCID